MMSLEERDHQYVNDCIFVDNKCGLLLNIDVFTSFNTAAYLLEAIAFLEAGMCWSLGYEKDRRPPDHTWIGIKSLEKPRSLLHRSSSL